MSPWKWFLISTAAVIVAVLLLTNPGRETHLKAIRDSGGYEDEYSIEYHYYFVFSTASTRYWGGRPKETLSYGFLGAAVSTKHYPKAVP